MMMNEKAVDPVQSRHAIKSFQKKQEEPRSDKTSQDWLVKSQKMKEVPRRASKK